jgi:hypothetical protein
MEQRENKCKKEKKKALGLQKFTKWNYSLEK